MPSWRRCCEAEDSSDGVDGGWVVFRWSICSDQVKGKVSVSKGGGEDDIRGARWRVVRWRVVR